MWEVVQMFFKQLSVYVCARVCMFEGESKTPCRTIICYFVVTFQGIWLSQK